ncbi:MAG: DUF4430 domain-containing protein [Clostridiales bacterium]|nr:DUF4430 domain-containing protein [Clostridiales bacterium]
MLKKSFMILIILMLVFSFGCGLPQDDRVAELDCTIAVTCHELAADPTLLESDKQGLVPEDGFILPLTPTLFFQEEDACNLLMRTLRASGIQIDIEKIPGTEDYYIKGINNLYEMDAGPFSGWLYKVNGEVLDYSSSAYLLQEGDAVEFFYTEDFSVFW